MPQRPTSGVEHDRAPSLPQVADYYRQRKMAAVVFTVDAHTALGLPSLSSEVIVAAATDHDDVIIPFASVDPHAGASAVARLRDLAAAGARGLKLHPSLQDFVPNDRAWYPSTKRPRNWPCRSSSTPVRPVSEQACPAGAASSCGTPTRC